MADTFRAKVHMTPIISLGVDVDGDAKDVIHHDIKTSLGGSLSRDASDCFGTARWWYTAATAYDTSHSDAITGNYTDGTASHTSDLVRMIYVEHLGIDEDGNDTNAKLAISLTEGQYGNPNAIILDRKESIVLKLEAAAAVPSRGCEVGELHFDVSQVASTVQAKVVALVDDVA